MTGTQSEGAEARALRPFCVFDSSKTVVRLLESRLSWAKAAPGGAQALPTTVSSQCFIMFQVFQMKYSEILIHMFGW